MTDFPKTIPWAFGSPAERAAGGVMGRLWMDSIFPYTTPEEMPEWWPEAFPPDGPGAVGAFPGFERNMRENAGEGAPNFEQSPPLPITEGRPFNIVLLNTNGLIQSDEAPYRLHTSAASEDVWPQNVPGGAILLLRLYVENYLHPDTRVILVIPEREIIHLGLESIEDLPTGSPSPNPALGSIGIREFVKEALKLLGDRLVGWFMIDEPDLLLFNKHLFATPETMTHVRDLIMQAEDEYAEAEEVQNWHRPCIINFSPNWYSQFTAPQPQDFACLPDGRVGLDMAWLDRYPWRISKSEVSTESQGIIDARDRTHDGEFLSDPIKTASIFRELVLRLNDGAGLGTAEYVPVMWFLQTHGAPYRVSDVHPSFLPSSAMEPNPPPEWIEFGTIKHARTLRRPTIDEARFEAWLSIFGGSEGLANYMQSKVADDLIWDIHRWVSHEISYFEGLRIQAPQIPFENLTKQVILKQYYHYSDAVKRGEMGAYMRPLVRIYRYSNPPSGASEEFWMFILNRANAQLGLTLEMPHGVWRWGLQEYKYGEPVVGGLTDLYNHVPKTQHGRRIKGLPLHLPLFPLGAHRFRLYKGVLLHPK